MGFIENYGIIVFSDFGNVKWTSVRAATHYKFYIAQLLPQLHFLCHINPKGVFEWLCKSIYWFCISASMHSIISVSALLAVSAVSVMKNEI